jgi:hypothetical protein
LTGQVGIPRKAHFFYYDARLYNHYLCLAEQTPVRRALRLTFSQVAAFKTPQPQRHHGPIRRNEPSMQNGTSKYFSSRMFPEVLVDDGFPRMSGSASGTVLLSV